MRSLLVIIVLLSTSSAYAQGAGAVSDALVRIIEAEDQRRWDESLAALFNDSNETVQRRAVIAAGRIGNAAAVPALSKILSSDSSDNLREAAAFGLGEIESPDAADALLNALRTSNSPSVRARALEALGKIAASLPETAAGQKKQIGDAIVAALGEEARKAAPNQQVSLLGLTAALRARPDQGPPVIALFLASADVRVRADALNALARIRAKQSLDSIRTLLSKDGDPIVRANAARALGAAQDAAQDTGTLDALILSATTDPDLRVRVSAIRALASLAKRESASALLARAQKLPDAVNEHLEIATALGTLLRDTNHEDATTFLRLLRSGGLAGVELETAYARISPAAYVGEAAALKPNRDWQRASAIAQALGEIATSTDTAARSAAMQTVRTLLRNSSTPERAVPDLLRALQAFKPDDLAQVARNHLKASDVIIRSAAADILGELPPSAENSKALADALPRALRDNMDDAARSIVGALGKSKDGVASAALKQALRNGGYVVRRQAAELLKADAGLANTRYKRGDYQRAAARIGKSVIATLTTDRGKITIQLLPDEAPLTVDNFISLARAHFFDGLSFHRVVPNFVIQGGDPRGDGNGGPGYQIRCEIDMVPFDRGAVGMALSGKDTGGSQFFITHSPQPHLDGGYTVFGRVTGSMNAVDAIVRGDRIRRVEISEN